MHQGKNQRAGIAVDIVASRCDDRIVGGDHGGLQVVGERRRLIAVMRLGEHAGQMIGGHVNGDLARDIRMWRGRHAVGDRHDGAAVGFAGCCGNDQRILVRWGLGADVGGTTSPRGGAAAKIIAVGGG